MTPVEKLQFKNAALRILHAPGGPLHSQRAGQAGGELPPLEMTIVFDGMLEREEAKTTGADVIATLKSAHEIFRNVRCNVVWWRSDREIVHEVAPAPVIQMGRCFADWTRREEKKRPEILFADLKKFEARSRLVIVAAKPGYAVEEEKLLRESLNPFLYRRLLWLENQKTKKVWGVLGMTSDEK